MCGIARRNGRRTVAGRVRRSELDRQRRGAPRVSGPHAQGRGASAALGELATLFLRLGTTAFGGPVAHIAIMEDEVVRRRRWLSRQEFLDLLGATNLIPGPNSTEMAIHIGHRRAGWAGLVVAGVCFILPATLIVGVLASLYVRFGQRPQADALLYGVKPVVIAVVFQALIGFGRSALTAPTRIAVAILAAGATLLGTNELLVLVAAGGAMALARLARQRRSLALLAVAPLFSGGVVAAAPSAVPFTLVRLFLFFAKVGSVLFGSGYVLLAFLRTDLVERFGWLTPQQLLDAIAIGQVTPGPVFTTATFVGYLLGGAAGAAVATIGIFLPAFVFVALSGALVPRLRRSPTAAAFLDGVIAASLALMAVVTWQLARAAIVDLPTALLAGLSALLLLRYRLNSSWLVLAGAVFGLGLGLLRP